MIRLKNRYELSLEYCLSNAHINLPFIAELCTKLKYYNIISKIELDSVKLVNNIWK